MTTAGLELVTLQRDWRLARGWQPIALQEPVPESELPTPALVVDVDQLESNLAQMAAFLSARGKAVRAHAKMHKSPIVAHRQLAQGAVGICVAKLGEAEILQAAGIADLLVTSPIASELGCQRLARLATLTEGRIACVVDAVSTVELLGRAVAAQGVRLDVLIDVDPRMGRTGARGAETVLAVAAAVAAQPALRLRGMQQYAGQVMHIESYSERRTRSHALWEEGFAIRDQLLRAGFPVDITTGGGTGTYDIDSELAPITDLQVGSYAYMDEEYLRIEGANGGRFETFAPSLFVLSTVISRPRDGAVTIDAGLKSFAAETVPPVPISHPGTRFRFAGDEHGVLVLDGSNAPPALGERVRLVASHCDPTVNLYDAVYASRAGLVSELWPISARGASY